MQTFLKVIFMMNAALVGALAIAQGQETLVDRIVATVDGSPVLHSKVEAKVTSGFFSISFYPAAEDAPVYEKALQDAINFELVLKKAEELEIEVSDTELDQEINFNLENRGQNREGLMEALRKAGIEYEEYREDFRKQMLFRRFQGMVVRPMIKITDKDVETFYLKKSGSSADNVRLTLRQILIKVPQGSSDDVVQAKLKLAKSVLQKLNSGSSFEETARLYSDLDGAKENGGLMPDLRLSELSESIRKEVEKLDVGKFTEPVRSPLGFHLFYLEGKKFSGSGDFQKKKKELENELMMAEGEIQTRKWLTDARRKADIKIVK